MDDVINSDKKNAYVVHLKRENKIGVMIVMKYVLVEKIMLNIIWKKLRVNHLNPSTILYFYESSNLP